MTRRLLVVVVALAPLMSVLVAQAPAGGVSRAVHRSTDDWPAYGGGPEQTRYSTLTQINRANIGRLQVAWQFDPREGQIAGRFQVNPIVIDSTLYTITPGGSLIALDGATGALKWSWNSGTRAQGRGVTYWSSGSEKRLLASFGRYIYAFDPLTGRPLTNFGRDGRIDLHQDLGRDPEQQSVGLSTPGVIYKDTYIVGGRTSEGLPASPGDIRAYDVRSGQLKWSFHTIPHPGEFGYETWPKDAWTYSGSANNWAGMAVDDASRHRVRPHWFCGRRFLRCESARRQSLCQYPACARRRDRQADLALPGGQTRHLGSRLSLAADPRDGATQRSVDRRGCTDDQARRALPVRSSERNAAVPNPYRRVPPSAVEGEVASETQPFPTKPAPFARQLLTEGMLTMRTPQAHQWAVDQFRTFRSAGQFVPSRTRTRDGHLSRF